MTAFSVRVLHKPNGRTGLPVRTKPYKAPLDFGLTLGYRRNRAGAGTWIAIVANGKGGQTEHRLGYADDEQAGPHERPALSFGDASKAARTHAAGRGAGLTDDPPTIDAALTKYETNLRARGANAANSKMPRFHLTEVLLGQRTDRVQGAHLMEWRDGLIERGMKRSTCNRVVKPLVAALNLVASLDRRVRTNAEAWKVGLKMLEDATVARDAILTEPQVKAVVFAAYDISFEFGLFVQMHAETGGRASQLRTLTVADFKGDRVMMPPHNKGKGERKSPTSVPVNPELAEFLVDAVGDRPGFAPLLRREDGLAWQPADQRYRFERARKAAKLPEGTTIYALRHSSIVQALQDGAPAAIVADWHTTSLAMLTKHYAAFMKDHHDDLIRRFLPNTAPGNNVLKFKRRSCS